MALSVHSGLFEDYKKMYFVVQLNVLLAV